MDFPARSGENDLEPLKRPLRARWLDCRSILRLRAVTALFRSPEAPSRCTFP